MVEQALCKWAAAGRGGAPSPTVEEQVAVDRATVIRLAFGFGGGRRRSGVPTAWRRFTRAFCFEYRLAFFSRRPTILRSMNLPQRKRLPHDIPLFVNVSQEVYFITLCCAERKRNQLATPLQAAALLKSVVHQNARKVWHTHLFLVMPDHVHGLFSFAPNGRAFKETMQLWKYWTAANLGIEWQRDFFEHRLRKEESRREKADYILYNPVRAGLVGEADEWPYVWWPDGDDR
jgi:REP element-mobilizing transposase RayT